MFAPRSLSDLLWAIRCYVLREVPGDCPIHVRILLQSGRHISHPIACLPPPAARDGLSRVEDQETEQSVPWVPTAFQAAILDALEGRALRADALGAEVGDRSRLYRHPGGIRELRDRGLVMHHPRRGYYRPDAPPEEMRGEGQS
jgi:hypothetical protein